MSPRSPPPSTSLGTKGLQSHLQRHLDVDNEHDRKQNDDIVGHSSQQPLLDQYVERGRPGYDTESPHRRPNTFTRRSTMRSRSPDTQAKLATKKKYTYAAFFLVLSLVSFVIQTETAVYIQHELKWDKAYCML